MGRKVGLFGGSFDPVHQGHIEIARKASGQFSLDQVIFIPTANPPHKNLDHVTNQARLEMVQLAVVKEKNFSVSSVEIERKETSYTIDTLKWFIKNEPDVSIYFIIGEDTLPQLETWKEAKAVFKLCHFLVAPRDGDGHTDSGDIYREKGIRFSYIQMEPQNISSTNIRGCLARGVMPDSIPPQIAGYISALGLYDFPSYLPCSKTKYLDLLRGDIGLNRLAHSLSTMETCVALAKAHHISTAKAALAGLLHDCAKEKTLEQMHELLIDDRSKISERIWSSPPLLHGYAGARWARKNYQVEDEEVLRAIAFHTVGNVPMSQIEIIVYLADGLEPMRKRTQEVDQIAVEAMRDLKQAMCMNIKFSITQMKTQGKKIEPTIYEVSDWLRKEGKTC